MCAAGIVKRLCGRDQNAALQLIMVNELKLIDPHTSMQRLTHISLVLLPSVCVCLCAKK